MDRRQVREWWREWCRQVPIRVRGPAMTKQEAERLAKEGSSSIFVWWGRDENGERDFIVVVRWFSLLVAVLVFGALYKFGMWFLRWF